MPKEHFTQKEVRNFPQNINLTGKLKPINTHIIEHNSNRLEQMNIYRVICLNYKYNYVIGFAKSIFPLFY